MKENKILIFLYKGIKEVIKGLSLKERAEAVCKICIEDLGLSLCWIGKKEKDGSVNALLICIFSCSTDTFFFL